MEIKNVDARAWETITAKLERLNSLMDRLTNKLADKEQKEWLDNQDVCEILNISKRTLQTYRDSGKLAYSQINHKVFYKAKDVQQLITENKKTI
ncbi:MAG: helix-turn-helix domain-containing protein [Rikenellaceae bacterium]